MNLGVFVVKTNREFSMFDTLDEVVAGGVTFPHQPALFLVRQIAFFAACSYVSSCFQNKSRMTELTGHAVLGCISISQFPANNIRDINNPVLAT